VLSQCSRHDSFVIRKEKNLSRIILYFSVALLTFVIGVSTWFANPLGWIKHESRGPLRVTISPHLQPASSRVSFEHYIVTIKNVSGKTVRGYSLGHTCDCRSWDNDGNPYPPGINFTNPIPERQVLRPGESQEMPLARTGLPTNESEPRVWADLVHFEHGPNWGPNQSHKEGYVRE
jgi:hypothetical protein